MNPDTNLFPDYTERPDPGLQAKSSTSSSTASSREDRSVIDLLTADYTFLNERLALHYGIPGVRGGEFRRVQLDGSPRAGACSARARVLMVTSYPNRTSPVLRGACVLEHIMGTPPAAPPPGVEALPESQEGGEQQTVRARLELHREPQVLLGCHGVIDPLGLALENFDALGQWRTKDIDAGSEDRCGWRAGRWHQACNGVDDLRELHRVAVPTSSCRR